MVQSLRKHYMSLSRIMEGFENLKHFSWRRRGLRTIAIVWSFFLLQTIVCQVSADLAEETSLLLRIKQTWGNQAGLSSWSSSTNPCSSWLFVNCDVKNVTINKLYLSGGSIADSRSSIPDSICGLPGLQNLSMVSLGLVGIIPLSIGNCKNLSYLNLSSNHLTGSIPQSIGGLSHVVTLNLSSNHLTGSIPQSIGGLSHVVTLDLSSNDLNGLIPQSMGELSSIVTLRLQQNSLSGPIPAGLSNLRSLQTLDLHENKLSGTIPVDLSAVPELYLLDLHLNSLSGEIPFFANSSLQKLFLQRNNLTGSIPDSLAQSLSLKILDLSTNNLSGSIPKTFNSLNGFIYINLKKNFLDRNIPPSLTAIPSLAELYLSYNNLTGNIPDPAHFGKQLKTLDLSHNFLTGAVPAIFLSQQVPLFPESSLFSVSLQDNCLNGTDPLTTTSNPALTTFSFDSNCYIGTSECMKCPSFHKKPRKSFLVIAVVAGSLLGVFAVLLVLFFMCKRRIFISSAQKPTSSYKGPVRQYTLSEVFEATEKLTTKIGEGGYATVYKAEFEGGTTAAVKRFNKKKPLENFEQEVQLLSHLNHRYLVNLIGYCEEKEELMLLYDFMDRGNLFENLHGSRSTVPLTWDERVKVLISVARGIEYLHYGTAPPMIHRDIKSANILLSDSGGNALNAKIADFGLGKHTEMDSYEMVPRAFGDEAPLPPPTRVAGTAGYLDPEYLTTSFLSPKSDVYSYGVVLLELITGRRPIFYDTEDGYDRTSLVSWAQRYLDENDLWAIVDPNLERGSFAEDQLLSVAMLARRCVDHYSRNRPTIREFLKSLGEVFSTETIPPTAEASDKYNASALLNLNLSNLEEFGPESIGFSNDYYDAHLELAQRKLEEATETSISMDFCSAQSELVAKQ